MSNLFEKYLESAILESNEPQQPLAESSDAPDEESDPKGFEKWWSFDSTLLDRINYQVKKGEIHMPSRTMLAKILKYEKLVQRLSRLEGFYLAREDRRRPGTLTMVSNLNGDFIFDDLGHVQRDTYHVNKALPVASAKAIEMASIAFVSKHSWFNALQTTQRDAVLEAIRVESVFNPRPQAKIEYHRGAEIVEADYDSAKDGIVTLVAENGNKWIIGRDGTTTQYGYVIGKNKYEV